MVLTSGCSVERMRFGWTFIMVVAHGCLGERIRSGWTFVVCPQVKRGCGSILR